MDLFEFNNLDQFLPDEQPCTLQTADFLNFTPLDDVFAEYDCLRRGDGDTPISSSNNVTFSAAEINSAVTTEHPLVPLDEPVRSRRPEVEASEASVRLQSSSAATSSDSGDEDYRPASRGSAAKSKPRPAGGVQKPRGRKGQRQNSSRAQELPGLQPKADASSMSGAMQPFDVIKNYGMGGMLSLQQLNDRIRSYCSMS